MARVTSTVPSDEVQAALNADSEQVALFSQHASAIPRGTRFDWKYEKESGRVNTSWKIETDNGKPTLQGWVPHHYRTRCSNLVH